MNCAICYGNHGIDHTFREMNFGTRHEFKYWECSACGCLQIVRIPENLGDYYPRDYYSFSLHVSPVEILLYRAYFAAPRLAQLIRRVGLSFQAVLDANLERGARILDVGCGAGKLVTVLRSMGFDAHGIDPFVTTETAYIHRLLLDAAPDGWDLIMFHHSLEHMPDNVGVLRCARAKLADGGICLVRIPIASWAWQHYGRDWVQLDAPRHLVIHTRGSFQKACQSAGLLPFQTTFDSVSFQFYGSELYKRDIPLRQEHAQIEGLSKAALRDFSSRAVELNRRELGDQASFYLKAAP